MQVSTGELTPPEAIIHKAHSIHESEPLELRIQMGRDVQEMFARLKERLSRSARGAVCRTPAPKAQVQKETLSPDYEAYLETFIQ
jgi:hypothetical protein